MLLKIKSFLSTNKPMTFRSINNNSIISMAENLVAQQTLQRKSSPKRIWRTVSDALKNSYHISPWDTGALVAFPSTLKIRQITDAKPKSFPWWEALVGSCSGLSVLAGLFMLWPKKGGRYSPLDFKAHKSSFCSVPTAEEANDLLHGILDHNHLWQ